MLSYLTIPTIVKREKSKPPISISSKLQTIIRDETAMSKYPLGQPYRFDSQKRMIMGKKDCCTVLTIVRFARLSIAATPVAADAWSDVWFDRQPETSEAVSSLNPALLACRQPANSNQSEQQSPWSSTSLAIQSKRWMVKKFKLHRCAAYFVRDA
eukprot:6203490-Pleurochrysis_carterae.AAC.6